MNPRITQAINIYNFAKQPGQELAKPAPSTLLETPTKAADADPKNKFKQEI